MPEREEAPEVSDPAERDEELIRQINLAFTTGEHMAVMLVTVVELAARYHPGLLRRALASVFDLSAVEEETRRVMASLERAQKRLYTLREQFNDLQRQIDQLQPRRRR